MTFDTMLEFTKGYDDWLDIKNKFIAPSGSPFNNQSMVKLLGQVDEQYRPILHVKVNTLLDPMTGGDSGE